MLVGRHRICAVSVMRNVFFPSFANLFAATLAYSLPSKVGVIVISLVFPFCQCWREDIELRRFLRNYVMNARPHLTLTESDIDKGGLGAGLTMVLVVLWAMSEGLSVCTGIVPVNAIFGAKTMSLIWSEFSNW